MAKIPAPPGPSEVPARPLPAVATAREAARVELARQQFMYDVLTVAATAEEQEEQLRKRIEVAEAKALEAETKANETIDNCRLIMDAAEQEKVTTLARLHDETEAATTLLRDQVVELQGQVDAKQAELVQIERDRDEAVTKVKDEIRELEAQRDAIQAEVDDTVHRIGDAVRAKLTRAS